jgi:predicted TIM-barrel fold metal-dependent hydrolase
MIPISAPGRPAPRWLEEFCATNPPRRAGVALVPITHGSEESVKEIEALAGKPGSRGIMIPTMWHDQPSYGHPSYDPVWAACAEAGLVVHTHSGEADSDSYNDNMAQFMLEVAFWTHRTLWQLLLAGKFDQFPNLKVRAGRVRVVVAGRPPVQDRRCSAGRTGR